MLSQPLWWRARQLRALLWPLIDRTAWAQPATVMAGTTGEGVALASVRFVGVGSVSNGVGGHDRCVQSSRDTVLSDVFVIGTSVCIPLVTQYLATVCLTGPEEHNVS